MAPTPFCLQVVGQITKNKSAYFLEKIRINSNKLRTVNHLFDILHQPIYLHPLFEAKINRKKGKQLIYLLLEGEDVTNYFDLDKQTFKYDGIYLKKEESELEGQYDYKLDPKQFINDFNKLNSTKSDSLKVDLLLSAINDQEDKNAMIKLSSKGYGELCNSFVDYFGSKHLQHAKDLFSQTNADNLTEFVEKKLQFFNFYTSDILFSNAFNIIKLDLNQDQLDYLNNQNIKDYQSLKLSCKHYDLFKNIKNNTLPARTSTTSIPITLSTTSTYTSSSQIFKTTVTYSNLFKPQFLNQTGTSLMDYSIIKDQTCYTDVSQPVKNKEFRDNVEYYTEKDQLFTNESLEKLLENTNKANQLQVNQLDSSSATKSLNEASNVFNKNPFSINDKLPIIDYSKVPQYEVQSKSKKTKTTGKRKASDSFYLPSVKYKTGNQKDKIERFMASRQSKISVNYKELSSESSNYSSIDSSNEIK